MHRSLPTLLLLTASFSAANAAEFTVTNIDDEGPGSLRQAILDANATPASAHHIRFGGTFPSLGIVELFSPLPALEVRVEINGMGLDPTITPFDPSNGFPLLRTSKSLTLRGFTLHLGRGEPRGGCVLGDGLASGSTLLIERMTFLRCIAVATAADVQTNGGAVSWPVAGDVTVNQSVFHNNAAISLVGEDATGGAIYSNGSVRVNSSYFIGNGASGTPSFGGAISLYTTQAGPIEIIDSVFVDSHATADDAESTTGAGGAISLDCTTCVARLERNFFGGNVSDYAGAVFVRGNDGSGSADLTLHNNSFVDNRASSFGGALFANGTRMDVRHVTFHNNASPTGGHVFTLNSSIPEWSNSVMADVATGSGPACSLGATATIAVGNFARAGDTSCNVMLPGSTHLADFRILGVDDGEQMPVVVFDPASPVVDGGDAGRCLAADARGRSRPQDGNGDGVSQCDAGAFERPAVRLFGDGFED